MRQVAVAIPHRCGNAPKFFQRRTGNRDYGFTVSPNRPIDKVSGPRYSFGARGEEAG